MNCRLEQLQSLLESVPQADYPYQSRVHPLQTFSFPSAPCYIKRDDELGFGISGSKIRKYRSLIPWLIQKKVKEVAVIGSASSNHVLGLSQLLIENNLKPVLFLRGDPSYSLKGNCLLTSLLVPSSAIHWIPKKEWHAVESIAHTYASTQSQPAFVLPEGGSIAASLPGALTLALDILENEKTAGFSFDHLFIEAGTGFMACALLLGMHWLQRRSLVHILLLAEDETAFHHRLKFCHALFLEFLQTNIPYPQNFILHRPLLTGGFGETSSLIFDSIKQIAQEEGFLTDPIYTAKLLLEGKHKISVDEIKGNILFIHSGGALALNGFHEQFHQNAT